MEEDSESEKLCAHLVLILIVSIGAEIHLVHLRDGVA
jgi:hypothetical protein